MLLPLKGRHGSRCYLGFVARPEGNEGLLDHALGAQRRDLVGAQAEQP
jgi:hypothetical protein